MVERARAIGFFERCFDGDTSAEVLAYLNGGLGLYEFPYIFVATFLAYRGLDSYNYDKSGHI